MTLTCLAAAAAAGCGGPPTNEVLLFGSLGNAIRDTGFACESVEQAEELDAAGGAWRVTCDGSRVYLANVRDDGAVCIERIPQGGTADSVTAPSEAQCTQPATP